jgi:hypothetical protein
VNFVLALRADEEACFAAKPSFEVYLRQLSAQRCLKAACHLKAPHTATTLRNRTDIFDGTGDVGPQSLTALYLIHAHSLDTVLDLTRRCPILAVGGTVEIRPLSFFTTETLHTP